VSDPLGGLQEPVEPAPEPRRVVRPPRPTTWALLIVIGVAFLVEALVGRDFLVEDGVALFRLGALYTPAVQDGDWWRLASYALLHIGWLHVLVNGYVLWSIAPQLEMAYGSNLTLGMFCATALAGGAASVAWSIHTGDPHLAAGASGGIFGLLGGTIALYLLVRKRLPDPVRQTFVRSMVINLLINVAIAIKAPVDTAAHLGGLLSGVLLGLAAPLSRSEPRRWHAPVRAFFILCALVFASMEGAAVARAVKPRPRTLRGPGVEAKVPWLFPPVEPSMRRDTLPTVGLARLPGVAAVEIERQEQQLRIVPDEDAVHVGDRTWLRRRSKQDGVESTVYEAADGKGTLVVDFQCVHDVCRGAAGDALAAQILRTARSSQ